MIDINSAAMTDCSPGCKVPLSHQHQLIFFDSYSDRIKKCTEDLSLKVRARHAWLPYKKCRSKRKLSSVCGMSCIKLHIG